jgi:hypothetical protein
MRKAPIHSAALVAANRRNAQESTGPRTEAGKRHVRLNALKHGRYAVVTDGAAEQPAGDFKILRQELLAAYDPPDAFAAKQVEELAELYAKLAQVEREQEAMKQRQEELLESERRRLVREMESEAASSGDWNSQNQGFLWRKDLPGRFREVVKRLETLLSFVEARDFSDMRHGIWGAIYGPTYTLRGRRIFELYKECNNAAFRAQPYDEGQCEELKQLLGEEIAEVHKDREAFWHERVEITPAEREAQRAPEGRQWAALLRHEHGLRRAIDRKVRILLRMREHAGACRVPGDSAPKKKKDPKNAEQSRNVL